MQKTHIYLIPGLAANPKIFEYLCLSARYFELHYIDWKMPKTINETIQNYTVRISKEIKYEKPILIGVSFGGILAQEISKIINCDKIIIISSIKSKKELPKRLKLIKKTKIYNLFPTKIIQNIEEYEYFFFNNFLKKRAKLYKKYLSIRDRKYLLWGIYNVLNWKQKEPIKNIIHIHGENDHIFPIKYIKDVKIIKGGSHIMILNKAKKISKIIENYCINKKI